MTESYLKIEHGAPCLYINGEKQEGLAYITYLTENNRYADFAATGHRLFSFSTFFGYNYLNEYSTIPVFSRGIFDDEENPDFSQFDRDVELILEACPEAYIFPRVNVCSSREWETLHPEECMELGEGRHGRASFASECWDQKVRRELTALITHIHQMPYADHIVGYQIAGGNTDEWLAYNKEAITGTHAEALFAKYCKKNGVEPNETNYSLFCSDLVSDRILEFATLVKELTNRKQVVGAFYGYTFEMVERRRQHHALKKILESDVVDFLCSPIAYSYNREVGRDHPYMVPVDSLKLHGKLYFTENDTRTHLTRAVNEMPHYNSPIWFGPDRETTCEVLKLHAAKGLVNNHAGWWFDMWGGWYDDPVYQTLLEKLRKLYEQSQNLPRVKQAETAVFVDENVFSALEEEAVHGARLVCQNFRETIGKLGTPVALYLSSDAEQVMNQYRAVISLVPQKSALSEKIAAMAKAENIPLLEIVPENAEMPVEEVRAFLKEAGVFLWCERDAVIYANESMVFLHTVEEGEYTVHTPGDLPLTDLLTGEQFVQGVKRPKGKSYLLRYGAE